MSRDWNELTSHERKELLPLIYAFPLLQREYEPNHFKVPIAVNGRAARIDQPLAPIIRCLWRNGFETIACCQGVIDNDGTNRLISYILFVSDELGGRDFGDILGLYEIPCERIFFDATITIDPDPILLHTVQIRFQPDDIEAIQFALEDFGDSPA